ncbi:MAG: hypothetical protein NW226_17635 [Microscillaceae bacterium]|nr:hypothetical protein [Microscillaceae bacterium]
MMKSITFKLGRELTIQLSEKLKAYIESLDDEQDAYMMLAVIVLGRWYRRNLHTFQMPEIQNKIRFKAEEALAFYIALQNTNDVQLMTIRGEIDQKIVKQ